MSAEQAFIELLRGIAKHPAARGLIDDAAVIEFGGRSLVLSKDMLVEQVHYLPDDLPEDVAWKLLAVNLSDLAAKAARPAGALLGYTLGDADWDRRFAEGFAAALAAFGVPLLGGDTVSGAAGMPRTLSLTVIGEASGCVPSRAGARASDELWVTGAIGDAGAGLAMLLGNLPASEASIRRYRAPIPRLEAGLALGPHVHAMMDVSDGLLIDAGRMAQASGMAVTIALDTIPLSAEFRSVCGADRSARLRAATAGDDYELLFAAPAETGADLLKLAGQLGLPFSRIGTFAKGAGLALHDDAGQVPLPPRLGYEHRAGPGG